MRSKMNTYFNMFYDFVTELSTVNNISNYLRIPAILENYDRKKRAYHNFDHIFRCVDECMEVADHLQNFNEVIIALFLHDVRDSVSDTIQTVNTYLSNLGFPKTNKYRIENLIQATNHKTPPRTEDQKYIVDIDLSILGQPTGYFDKYEVDVRNEFQFHTETRYCIGRRTLLKSFLNRKSIYYTDHFKKKYNRKAKENIKRSLLKIEEVLSDTVTIKSVKDAGDGVRKMKDIMASKKTKNVVRGITGPGPSSTGCGGISFSKEINTATPIPGLFSNRRK